MVDSLVVSKVAKMAEMMIRLMAVSKFGLKAVRMAA